MIFEQILLNNNAVFAKESGEKVVFAKGTRLGCVVENEDIKYVDENGDRFTSCTPDIPTKVTNNYRVIRPTIFYVYDDITKNITESKYLKEGDVVTRTKQGNFYDPIEENLLHCSNENNLERILLYPSTQVKAEAEETQKKKVFELNPNAKYCGDDGIDAAILFMQTADLSKHIVRDDKTHLLFVDLGPAEMWTDIDNSSWIMKLNARIPLASACSVGKRTLNGKQRLAVVLNSNFV